MLAHVLREVKFDFEQAAASMSMWVAMGLGRGAPAPAHARLWTAEECRLRWVRIDSKLCSSLPHLLDEARGPG